MIAVPLATIYMYCPTSQPASPLKEASDPPNPEWKKQPMERKKTGASTKKPDLTLSEPEMPAWKKEPMSKRKTLLEVSGGVLLTLH